ncbi:Linoleate 10R-lipoxygenase-like protein [Elsinoe fawcettii]|nr:Linoleate 10R-lipoxygenase-like protein [Elsinoe fawcettii]
MPSIVDRITRRFSTKGRKAAEHNERNDSVQKASKSDSSPQTTKRESNASFARRLSQGWKLDKDYNGESENPEKQQKSNAVKFKAVPELNQESEAVVPSTRTDTEAQSRYPEPAPEENEPGLADSMTSFLNLISHAMRPPNAEAGTATEDESSTLASKLKDLSTIGIGDLATLKDKLTAGKDLIDDKTMLMERVIQLVADLPDKSETRTNLTNQFIDQLFFSVQHPPLSYLGDKFKYRQPDGSHNNIMYPHIGAANTPYARTVAPETVQTGALPDPGLIFDSLFARDTFRPHPNKNSSIIFYWASIIIHDLFQTDHDDFNMSQTSSYLDLSPLYGDTQEDQNQVRSFRDGKLKPDCFSEHRLLTFPPGCGVILIMFNRFHNYVAEQLAAINENGKFSPPRPGVSFADEAKVWAKRDHDLFNTARLVTSGLYMNITLIDYVRTIINLNRSNTTWTLDPRVKMGDSLFHKDGTPRGIGNQVSVEFNLVYRWHSAISERDEAWTENLFRDMFKKSSSDISMPEMLKGLKEWETNMPKDPSARDFHKLPRGVDGRFSDDDLVDVITSSIEDCAGAFGANHVPKCLKAIEILGMKQARAWECASLNEFRKFFGLAPHKSFEDVNPSPIVAEQFKNLYGHPDKVELYPGLVAEQAKVPMTEDEGGPVGVGISPTYTISRAVLSDAVALVRGDRFYTVDYHPKSLTNWGFTEVNYDFTVEQGCSFYKLFIRAFPLHFKPNSIYAHQPMTIPSENRKIMQSLGRESHYSWDRPARQRSRILVQDYQAVKTVLEDTSFKVIWGDATGYLMGEGGRKFMLSGDGSFYTGQKEAMHACLYKEKWHENVMAFYEKITLELVKRHTVKIAGKNQLDFTRDVGNLAHVHFAAGMFSLPLKTADNPRGIFTESELYLIMAGTFILIFFDVDPVKTFPLSLSIRKLTQTLGKLVEANVNSISATSLLSPIIDPLRSESGPLSQYGVHLIRRLLSIGLTPSEATWSQILPTAVAMVGNQAQVITQILDFYLSPGGKEHWPEICRLAKLNTTASDDLILRYAQEANRINGTFGSYRSASKSTTINDEGYAGKIDVKEGDKIFVSFVKAAMDPDVFPEPDKVKLDRPIESYLHYGKGPHECLGRDMSRVAMTAMLKTMARLEGLRPAPGDQGVLKKVDRGDGFYAYMTEDWGKFMPFPTTWKLHFDGEIPES